MFKMFSCRDISKIACHKEDMGLAEKMNFRIHLFMCRKCREYTASLEQVGKSFSEVIKRRRVVSKSTVDDLENRVLDSLKKKNGSQ